MLELHQDEVENLSNEVIEALADPEITMMNDLRTVFLMHDKRFLTLLTEGDLLANYLSPEEIATVQQSVIPSYRANDLPTSVRRTDHRGYLLKPALAGKGEGIIFADELNSSEWNAALAEFPEHIVQPIIDQKLYPLRSHFTNGELVHQPLVATFCCMNDRYIGPGIFRSGPQRLIAVSRGGEILVPRVAKEVAKTAAYRTVDISEISSVD